MSSEFSGDAAADDASPTWRRLCGTPAFQPLDDAGAFLSPCCQALAVDVPVCALYLVAAALCLDRALRLPDGVERPPAAHRLLTARLWLSLLLAAISLVRLAAFAALTERWWAAAALSPLLLAAAWMVAALVSGAARSRLLCGTRGPPALLAPAALLLALGAVHLAGSVLAYRRVGGALPLAQLCCDATYLAVGLARLLTLLPGGPAGAIEVEREPLLVRPSSPAGRQLGAAEHGASCFSLLTFWWTQPLMRRGRRRQLHTIADLHQLPRALSTDRVDAKFTACLRRRAAALQARVDADTLLEAPPPTSQVSLLGVLMRCFGVEYLLLGVLKFVADLSTFAGPLLLNAIIAFIEDEHQPMSRGYSYAAMICAANVIGVLCTTQYDYRLAKVGLKVRAAFIATIYRKTLDVPLAQLAKMSSGEVMTYMSVDTDRVVNLCSSFHAFWSLPFQFCVTLYLLYWQIGVSFLSGLAFAVALVPLNKWIANKTGEYSAGMLEHKDDRVKLTSEVLQGIRTVKFSGWESFFAGVIGVRRAEEVRYLKKQKYLDAWCVFFWATTPVLMCLLTFGTYVLLGNQLTAATVFTTIALLNMLKSPINAYPWALNGLVDSLVSIRRVQRLLALPDLDPDQYYCPPDELPADAADCDISIRQGFFHWGAPPPPPPGSSEAESPASSSLDASMSDLVYGGNQRSQIKLWDVSVNVRRGQVVGLMGPVGCGKSSLVYAVLGELIKEDGLVHLADRHRGVGLVSQDPWLQQGTVRDNILFGSAYNVEKYRSVIAACALTADLDSLPAGDLTQVTQNGASLSGGQRVRVALARAVYQDLRVYILDDIFSSLDPRVARHVMNACVRRLLRGASVLLCCHQASLLRHADWLVVMERGWVSMQGPPAELLAEAPDSPTDPMVAGSDDSASPPDSPAESEALDTVLAEERVLGAVRWPVYTAYYRAVGRCLAPLILASVICMQASSNATDLWLGYFVTGSSAPGNVTLTVPLLGVRLQAGPVAAPAGHQRRFFQVYGGIAALNASLALLRSFLFAYGGVRAARVVHDHLLQAVLQADLSFFAFNPVGRIVNRFSSDLFTIDSSLPFILNILLAQMAGLTGFTVVTVISLPWIGLLLLPLGVVYYYIQNFYRYTSRELKRLSTLSLSPVYVHFVETLSGLATVRALRGRDRMILEMSDRLEQNQRARFATQASVAWLNFRLQMIGVVMVTGVALLAVFKHHVGVQVHAGLVGLAISCALSVTGFLSGLVGSFTETEKEMVSMERVHHYITAGGEEDVAAAAAALNTPPADWPERGRITFVDVTLRYRGSLRPALCHVSFTVEPGQSLGVVGRTGSGKSSLLAALFRMHPLCDGAILLDDLNITHVSLQRLRQGLSVIPQQPFLYSGSVRQNLDPSGLCSDTVLWAALTECHLRPVIDSLDMQLSEQGRQLSQGQRQLLCLARALLRQSQVVCLDEATASLDPDTDRLIQATVQDSFRTKTVISIGHRVSAVRWCDQVLVMADGELVEMGTPSDLLTDPGSAFSALFRQQQQQQEEE
ncbi:multidrug resistance-associated protein 7-like [Pollicipes pollicipes]|uniref:multidrug resistance-associated protein 7-like n=1 Tax=Pollicipes pollicipes TaxID=41117 RepID=UPI001884DE72|nr:multidrug resistance-associated protein 7-like [Pollicipes pollicipes]